MLMKQGKTKSMSQEIDISEIAGLVSYLASDQGASITGKVFDDIMQVVPLIEDPEQVKRHVDFANFVICMLILTVKQVSMSNGLLYF